MKRIVVASLLFAAVGMTFTSCLKDKGYDNHQYGINDPDTQPPGVGFPLGAKAKNTVGLNVQATTQTINDIVYVNLNSGSPAPSDIQVTLTVNSGLVTAYNTANGTNIQILSPTLYTVGTTLTIPAGARNVQVPIVVPNTTSLDPNKTYGVGLTISAVSGNYVIAGNMKNLLVEFTIKNKYDGKYQLRGYHNRNSPDYTIPYNVAVYMITSGPNSVVMWYPTPGPNTYAHPINGNGGSYYGSFAPNFTFDPVTNLATGVVEWYAGTTPMNILAGSNSRFEPGPPKMMYLLWRYNNNDLRRFYDTLTYIGPRP